MIKTTLLTGLALIFAGNTVLAEESWTVRGFNMPESVIFDASHNRIILSTIVGTPSEADGKGDIVLLSPDGDVIDAAWATGLDAPKGMAILGDILLVTDLTRLHEIDLATGEIRRSLDVPDAVFLNDVTSNHETAYITDMLADTIWRYSDGVLEPWLSDPMLSHPNGIFLDNDRLIVGSWGAGLREDFTTEVPGSLLSVALDTQEISVIASEVGNLDGITRINDAIIVSDWVSGALFSVDSNGNAHKLAQLEQGLADISSQNSTLYMPMMFQGTLKSQQLP